MVDLNSLYRKQNAGVNAPVDLNALYQQQNGKVDLNDVYNQQQSNAGSINMDVVEEIESHGDNSATSKTGAKGILQFEPATAREYSKRLFGHEVSDASTLSLEQQKEMANAYFNDLLKEFHGNEDEAIAAYNWGQGNLEKDISAHGSNWLEYAPEETQKYVAKYNKLTGKAPTDYAHDSYQWDDNKSRWENSKENMKEQFEQLGDMWNGLTAYINKETGNEYNKEDLEQVKEMFNTDEGKALKAETAVAASVVAPEFVPELEGAGLVGKGASWLGKGLAGSLAYQGVKNGDATLKQTAEDMAWGAGLESGFRFLAAPAIKQVSNALGKFLLSEKSNPELTNAVKEYLAAGRAEEVGHNWKYLREAEGGAKATLLDAYESMYEQVPEFFKAKDALEEVKALTRRYKINGSHSQLIEEMNSLKNAKLAEARELAKTDAEQRLIQTVQEASEAAKGKINVADDVMKSTPFQKAGEKAADWFGFTLPKSVKAARSAEQLKPEADEVKDLLQRDNARIGREIKKQLKRPAGASSSRKLDALRRQLTANRKMIEFINNGMAGKKVKVADIQSVIKEVQEEQFNRGKFRGITSRFKSLADKFELMQVHKLSKDSSVVGQIAEGAMRKASHHVVTHALGLGALPLGITSTVAGKLAQMSKVGNLRFASELAKMVESGELTEQQAERLIVEKFTAKAELARLFAPAASDAL